MHIVHVSGVDTCEGKKEKKENKEKKKKKRQCSLTKSTTPQPLVDSGSVKPVLLQGMMIVEEFIMYVGGLFGT